MTFYKKITILFLVLISIILQDAFAVGALDNVARAAAKQIGKGAVRNLRNADNVLKHSGRYANRLINFGWRKGDSVTTTSLSKSDLTRINYRHGDTVSRLGLKEGDDLIRNFSKIRVNSRSSNITTSSIPSNRIRLPRDGVGGKWENPAMRGNSTWNPNMNEIPKTGKASSKNFNELISGNINKDYSGIGLSREQTERLQHNLGQLGNGNTGIKYVNNDPDFSPYSAHTMELKSRMTGRYNGGTSTEADKLLAEKLGMKEKDVRDWINNNQYVWHERADGLTVDLVSHDINGNFAHAGGISLNKYLASFSAP